MPAMHHSRNQRGFTLLELMIVVAIVVILVTLAVNGYQSSVTKTRRSVAAACLVTRAQAVERFYTTAMTYVGAGATLPSCGPEVTDNYGFSNDSFAATTYTLRAIPDAEQLARDPGCATLSIDDNGTKAVTGSNSAKPQECWR